MNGGWIRDLWVMIGEDISKFSGSPTLVTAAIGRLLFDTYQKDTPNSISFKRNVLKEKKYLQKEVKSHQKHSIEKK